MICLVACEESQAITIQLRKLGHTAFSCDLQDCSGGFPEWHIKGDCLSVINGHCSFITSDGVEHSVSGCWDLVIAHPPCTYLSFAGNKYFDVEKYGLKAIHRMAERQKAYDFFMSIWCSDTPHLCVENPTGYINQRFRSADQVINPFEFGDLARKRTCLWLRGLPKLMPTYSLPPPEPVAYSCGKPRYFTEMCHGSDRQKQRSKTFEGIARAMAWQFTNCFYY